jgi:large subunit ribosomal protein L6
MSRIGKQPISIPEGVEIKITDNQISVKGPKGELKQDTLPEVDLVMEEKELKVKPKNENASAVWGLTRALVANMVKGVTEGFEKKLEIEGVGFRAVMEGEKLVLSLGLSHLVYVEAPEGIKFSVEKNVMTVAGIDKQLVGQTAAKIRDLKKPEPYKGKGIHYLGEVVRRKAGKKAVGSE